MLSIEFTTQFKRDFKRAQKRGCDPKQLEQVLMLLASETPLPPKYRDHALTGDYAHCRECHIQPDWLLIYEVLHDRLLLRLIRTGSHSDLF